MLMLMLMPLVGSTESSQYSLLKDYVQYSSSVDAYSKMCVKNFKSDSVESELFELVDLLSYEIGLSDKDIQLLKNKYNRISISTLSQLKRLGLDKEKRLCVNYLKVFERFDEKKNEKLNEILGLIEK